MTCNKMYYNIDSLDVEAEAKLKIKSYIAKSIMVQHFPVSIDEIL